MTHCLISLNGSCEKTPYLEERIPPDAHNIAVDGGLRHLEVLGIKPHRVLGDLDSISQKSLKALKETDVRIESFPTDKDSTDFELAIGSLNSVDYEEVTIIGAAGGRVDHTLTNYLIAAKQIPLTKKVVFLTDDSIGFLYRQSGAYLFQKSDGPVLSLVSLSGECHVESLTGVQWTLSDLLLTPGKGLTMSNMILEEESRLTISTDECSLLVFQSIV